MLKRIKMEHIKQNDKNCIKLMRDIGCFVRSCGLVAEYKTGKSLTVNQINDLWHWCSENKLFTSSYALVASAPVINHALEILGDKGKFIEVGIFSNGKCNWYKSVHESFRKVDALIQKVRQNGPSGTHFRLVDKYGDLIEDPHEPVIKPTSVIYSIIYCYKAG